MSSNISGYSQYNVNSYYSNTQSTSFQPQQQPPQTDFSQMLSSGVDSRSGASGVGMSDSRSGASGSMQSSSSFQASLDKMMFMASTQNLGQTSQSGQSGSGGFMSDLQSLSSALNSGDLNAAKDAFSKIESHFPQNGQNTASTTSGQTDTSSSSVANTQDQRAKDFAALQSALDSGNTSAAKDALATIMQDAKQSKGHGGHHHGGHHGGGGGLNALMDTQSTSQTTDTQDLAALLMQQSSSTSQGGSGGATSQSNLANILLQQQLKAYSSIQSATA